jgi:diguanylate cyclase (GGDEF)-like protein
VAEPESLPGLFDAEEQLADRAAAQMRGLEMPPAMATAFTELLDGYRRLLRESKRLVRIADRREAELSRLNRRLGQLTHTLAYQADHDPLTGAYNKGAITRLIEESLAAGPCVLMILDIDHFKRVNDERGHPCGDYLLQVLVDLLHQCLGDEALLGRFGGEEFVVLRRGALADGGNGLAETIRASVAGADFAYAEQPLRITASLGVCACAAGDSFASVYRRMDAALYTAKRSGRNRVVRAPEDKE